MLTAVASDDLLFEQLVLKGGNALELIHRISERASLDLDFSMKGDARDVAELEARLRRVGVRPGIDKIAILAQAGGRMSATRSPGHASDPSWLSVTSPRILDGFRLMKLPGGLVLSLSFAPTRANW